MTPPTALAIAGAGGFAIGAIAGSFIGTLFIRWPDGLTMGGRSKCDRCDEPLRTFELIPLLSYLVQGGRCRRCGTSIAIAHFGIELVCALVGAMAFLRFPGIEGCAGAYFGWMLVALATLDFAYFWLPDRLTFLLGAMGFLTGFSAIAPTLQERLIGGAAGFGALAGIAWSYRRLRGREGMGEGDPKLLGAIGLWVGWQDLPLILVGASGAGIAWILVFRYRTGTITADSRIPLGALMAAAAFPVWLFNR